MKGTWSMKIMKVLWCWYCLKPVSSPLPPSAEFRAIAVCPECLAGSSEAKEHPLSRQLQWKHKTFLEPEPKPRSCLACVCKTCSIKHELRKFVQDELQYIAHEKEEIITLEDRWFGYLAKECENYTPQKKEVSNGH